MFCLDSKQTEVGLNWQQGMTPQRIKVQLVQATALSPHSKAIIICDQSLNMVEKADERCIVAASLQHLVKKSKLHESD